MKPIVDNVSPLKNDQNLGLNRIMLFELSVGGHYLEYISYLIEYWCEYNLNDKLDIIVSPQSYQKHAPIIKSIEQNNTQNIKFVSITHDEFANLKSFSSSIERNIRAWQEYKLIRKYADKLKPNHIFLPYFDTRQLPIIFGSSLPYNYSGIYFRPSFHYKNFDGYRSSWREKIQHLREKFILAKILKDSRLKTLFCLDPFAIESINQIGKSAKAVYLPDPVRVFHQSSLNLERLKSDLGIENSRKVCLLFGELDRRKGIDKLLEAIALLPSDQCQQLCFLFVGSMQDDYYNEVIKVVTNITEQLPVQIVINNQYIPEIEIQSYFELADLILAVYQRHIGMSGILNRAAVANKPVLSSDYGLMGILTHSYKLGLTVDSTKAEEIAQRLNSFLTQHRDRYCDRIAIERFARQHSPQEFAKGIVSCLCQT